MEDMAVHLFHRPLHRGRLGWAILSTAGLLLANRPTTTRFKTRDSTALLMRYWEGTEQVVMAAAVVDIKATTHTTTALLAMIEEAVEVAGGEVEIAVVVAGTTMAETGPRTTRMTTARGVSRR